MREILSRAGVAALLALSVLGAGPLAANAAGSPGGGAAGSPAGSSNPSAPALLPAPAEVPLSDTDGQPAAALLANALQLLRAGMEARAVTAVGSTQSKLETAASAVQRDQALAAAATSRAAAASAQASSAEASYEGISGAVKAAAVYLYMTGGSSPPVGMAASDRALAAQSYEDSTLGPAGVLQTSFQLASEERSAFAAADSARKQAVSAYQQADKLLAQEKAEVSSLQTRLASTPGVSAATVATDELELASQAGGEVASPGVLQFAPKAALPAPLSTTAVAVAWAFSELGKPYLWGGTGPDEFDCSGLTQYVWGKAGVPIPRVAADQYAWTVPVPLSQLLPGDLVFYGTTDIHHVGIYIGNGLMINAPHTGTVVQVSSIWWSDLAGFGRVHDAGVPVPARVLPSAAVPAPKAVVAKAGPVPSQASPPPGWKARPGQSAPVAEPAPAAPPAPTTTTSLPAGGQDTTTTSSPAAVTTTTTPGGPLGL